MKKFQTQPKETKVIEFELDDVIMEFRPPKRAGLIASIVAGVSDGTRTLDTDSTKDLLNWLGDGLSEENATHILERLQDPDDEFDLTDVNDIAKYLLGQASNRPTRRR